MPDYHALRSSLWDKPFRALRKKDPNAQTLYLYLASCRNRRSEGLFELPKEVAAIETGMTLEEIEAAFEALIEAGYVMYDSEKEVVLDVLALKYFQPAGEKQLKRAVSLFKLVPNTSLKAHLVKQAMVYAPAFAEQLQEECQEWTDEALSLTVSDTPSRTRNTVSTRPDTPSTTADTASGVELLREELGGVEVNEALASKEESGSLSSDDVPLLKASIRSARTNGNTERAEELEQRLKELGAAS